MNGQVDILIEGFEARFSWKPDEAGVAWTVDSLRSLLNGANILVEIKDSDLEAALDFFRSSEGGTSEIVAHGEVPVTPEPRKIEIQGEVLPENIKAVSDVILKSASSLGTDEECNFDWAEEGCVVGTVYQPVSSRAGIALNKDPVAPPEQEGENFEIGQNLEIRSNNLIALSTGILRYTGTTADIFPCDVHRWTLDGSPDAGGCFLNFRPGHDALPLPSVLDIVSAAGMIGFLPEKLLDAERIRALLATAFTENQELESVPLSADTDRRIDMVIDELKTRADLKIIRETGDGVPLELTHIAAAIRDSGLRGVDGEAVKAAIMAFWKSDANSTTILLKEGIAPQRGPDRELELEVPFLEEEHAAPIRERLEFEPDLVRGILSLKEYPPSAISKMAIAVLGQQVARLGSPKAGKPGKDIYGNQLPGFPGNDPIIHVHEGLEWDGDNLIARDSGILDIGATSDGVTHARIRPHKEAEIRIDISPDKIKAFVSTRLPIGTGSDVSDERILDAAEKAGVVKGFQEEAIREIVERALSGEIISQVLIAEGQLPLEGNTRLSLAVSGDPAKAVIPVKAGELIGTIESGDGAGWDVLGELLVDEGSSLTIGENILREENESVITLKAEKGGHLQMAENQLVIRHLLDYVGDVSLASGNVRFPGQIKIDGSILSRVIVDGGEGVEVSQVIQAALVNSGGDVTVGKGIKGEGKAVVRSQGDIRLGYAEEANLLATGDIHVAKALMNCRVKCNGKLDISATDGRVVGGVMKLKDGLICGDVGNQRGTETVVSFGQDYLVENQIDQVQKELIKILEFIDKTDQMMAELEQKPGSGKKLIMVRQKKIDALKMQEKKNMRLFLLREKFERHFESEVRINGTAWPGCTFESHGRLIKVVDPIKAIRIFFDREKGSLVKKPI